MTAGRPRRLGLMQVQACRPPLHRAILTTVEQLADLPIGSIVMALWDDGPLHHVMQKYSPGSTDPGIVERAGGAWYGSHSDHPYFPLGSARNGEQVILLWEAESRPEALDAVTKTIEEVSADMHRAPIQDLAYYLIRHLPSRGFQIVPTPGANPDAGGA